MGMFHIFSLICLGCGCLEPHWSKCGANKIYFLLFINWNWCCGLQLLLYYYQVDNVNIALTDYGLTAPQISSFYNTAELPTAAIDKIGEIYRVHLMPFVQ